MPDNIQSIIDELADSVSDEDNAQEISTPTFSLPPDISAEIDDIASEYLPEMSSTQEPVQPEGAMQASDRPQVPVMDDVQKQILIEAFSGSDKGKDRLQRIMSGQEPIPEWAVATEGDRAAREAVSALSRIEADETKYNKPQAVKAEVKPGKNEGFTKEERERIIKQAEKDQGVSRYSPKFDWTNALLQIPPEQEKTIESAAKETGEEFGKIPILGSIAGGAWQGANRLAGGVVALAGMAGSKTAEAAGKKIHDIVGAFGEGATGTESKFDQYVRGVSDSLTQMYLGSFVPGGQYLAPTISQAGDSYYEGKKAGLKGKDLAGYVAGNAAAEIAYGLMFKGAAKLTGKAGIEGVERLFGNSTKNIFKSGIKEIAKDFGWATFGELTEEEMTSFTQAILNKFYGVDPNALTKENAWALFRDTAIQTLMTLGVSHAPHYTSNILQNRAAKKQIVDETLDYYGIDNPTEKQKAIMEKALENKFAKEEFKAAENPSRGMAKGLSESDKILAKEKGFDLSSIEGRKGFQEYLKQKDAEAERLVTKPVIEPEPAVEQKEQVAQTEKQDEIVVDKPGIEEMTEPEKEVFKSQLEIEIEDLKNAGFTDEQIKKFQDSALYGAKDDLTGMQAANLRTPTMNRAIEHIAKTGEPGVYAEIDLANLGGLNKAKGHTGANKVFSEFADIIKDEVGKLGGSINTFRHGGDEMSVIAVGIDDVTLRKALDNAKKRASEVAKREGVADISHPKHENNSLFNGVGLEYETAKIVPGRSAEDIFSEADTELELRKERKIQEGGENVQQVETAQTRPVTSEGQGLVEGTGKEVAAVPKVQARTEQAKPKLGAKAVKQAKVVAKETVTPTETKQEAKPTDEIGNHIQNIERGEMPDDIQGIIDQVGGIVRNPDTIAKIRKRMAEMALEQMKGKKDAKKADAIAAKKIKSFIFKAAKKAGVFKAGMTVEKARQSLASKLSKAKAEGKAEGARKATYKQVAITYLQKNVDKANWSDLLNKAKKVHTEAGMMKFMDLVDDVSKGKKVLPERVLMTKNALNKMLGHIAKKYGKKGWEAGGNRIVKMHKELAKYAKDNLPVAVRGRVMNAIVNSKTYKQFQNAFKRIDVARAHEEHRQAIVDLKKSIKKAESFTAAGEKFHKMIPEVKKAMQELLGGIDVKKRSAKMREIIESINNDESQADMPEDVAKYLDKAAELADKTNVYDMTTDELHQLKDLVDYMLHFQKEQRSGEVKAFVEKVNNTVKQSTERMGPVPKTPNNTVKIGPTSIPRRVWNRIGENLESLSILFDNNDNGPMLEVYEKWLDSMDTWHKRTDSYWDAFKNRVKITDADKNWTDFMGKNAERKKFKLESGATVELSPAQMMSMYLLNKNEEGRGMMLTSPMAYDVPITGKERLKRIVWHGRDTEIIETPLTEQDIDNIIGSLTDKQIEYAEAIGKTMNTEMKNDLNKATRERYGYDFATKEDYFPQFRLSSDVKMKSQPVSLQIAEAIKNQNVVEGWSSLKARTGGTATYILPDVFQVFTEHAQRVGSVSGLLVHTRFLKSVINNKEWRRHVESKYGKDTYAVFRRLIDRTEGSIRKNPDEKFFQKLRNNYAAGALVLTPSVWLSQPLSLPLAATEIDGKYLFSESLKNFVPATMTKTQKDILAKMREKSYMLESRTRSGGYQRELGNLAGTGELLNRMHNEQSIRQKAGWAMGKFDNYAIERIMLAAHAQAMAEGKTFDEAVKLAERAVRRSQPTFNMATRTWLGGHESEILQQMTMFRSYLDKALVNLSINMRKKGPGALNKQLISAGTVMLLGPIMNATRLYVMRGATRGKWDDFGSYLDRVLDSVLGMFPFIGTLKKKFQAYVTGKEWMDADFSPTTGVVSDLLRSMADFVLAIANYAGSDDKSKQKAIAYANKGVKKLSSGAKAAGVPDVYRRALDVYGLYKTLAGKNKSQKVKSNRLRKRRIRKRRTKRKYKR